MRKLRACSLMFVLAFVSLAWPTQATAQVGIVTGVVKRVIKAIDLQIQRLQNKTIWLQNAQKEIENEMQKLHLTEITGWVQKQKALYASYYDELWRVKEAITYYHRIREIVDLQAHLVAMYQQAWKVLKQDQHFTAEELEHMQDVLTGILNESVKNVDELGLVVQSFITQMSDVDRLQIINHAAVGIEHNYTKLVKFYNENITLSINRGRDEEDVNLIKKLYGIE